MSKILDITKSIPANKSNIAEDVLSRILQCEQNGDACSCLYCAYKKKCADMLYEIMIRDMEAFQTKTGKQLASYDMKLIAVDIFSRIEKYEVDSLYKEPKTMLEDLDEGK